MPMSFDDAAHLSQSFQAGLRHDGLKCGSHELLQYPPSARPGQAAQAQRGEPSSASTSGSRQQYHQQMRQHPGFGRSVVDARFLYEQLYCARGEAENRIGEQFELFADRASSATMQANQLRMSFSAMAYVLVDTLRRVGLRHSQFADAAVATIRLKLLKLGAQVRTSVRRIHFAIASGCPNKDEFELAHIYLQRAFSSA